jgi:hypothetical protein
MLATHKILSIAYSKTRFFKRLAAFALFFVSTVFPQSIKAQSLVIQSATLPDTVYIGSSFTLTATVWNDNDESHQGNLQFWFLNHTNDSLQAALGGFINTLQFFGPQQVRTFQIEVPVTPDFFLEGGNTVVIWPSMVGEPLDPQSPFLSEVYVLNPNGSLMLEDLSRNKFRIDKHSGNELIVRSVANAQQPKNIQVLDLSGRILKNSAFNASDAVDISALLPGIYIVMLRFDDGQIYSQKIIKSNR